MSFLTQLCLYIFTFNLIVISIGLMICSALPYKYTRMAKPDLYLIFGFFGLMVSLILAQLIWMW